MSTASWLSRALLPWYREQRRELPWRSTSDPYRIWLSEVILQQTRVDQGLAYWERFVERYPTVGQLAAATEDEVLRLWQGLGYYSRARNLLQAARQVMEEHGGMFPADHSELKGLKGVGDYTASAIASIAFGIPEPVVDGNVYRVLGRVFGISTPIDSTEGRREFRALAAEVLDRSSPGDHNQAMMELGATVCSPLRPRCGECPLAERCVALREGTMGDLPVKAGRTKVRTRHFNYLHITSGQGLVLQRREGRDIWQGLYELPLIETGRTATKVLIQQELDRLAPAGLRITDRSAVIGHVLTHQRIQAVFWKVTGTLQADLPAGWLEVPLARVDAHALPRLIERYLKEGIPATSRKGA
jgi:A/G-specific adenine glycosylase